MKGSHGIDCLHMASEESWCELGGVEVDTRHLVQTCGFVFNLGIHICHPSSLSLIYILEAQAPSIYITLIFWGFYQIL